MARLVDEVHYGPDGEVVAALGIDLTSVQQCLYRNIGVAFMGDTKSGPFDVPGEQLRARWLSLARESERSAPIPMF